MALEIEINNNNQFRVKAQTFFTDWLPNISANRKIILIVLRYLRDADGEALFTFKDLAVIVGSGEKQAASKHVEEFRKCEEDFLKTIQHKCKADEQILESVLEILEENLLLTDKEIIERISKKLNRSDITMSKIRTALNKISAKEIRKIVKKQISNGKMHYKEEYLLNCFFEKANEKVEGKEAGEISQEIIENLKASKVIEFNKKEINKEVRKKVDGIEEGKSLFNEEVNKKKLTNIWKSPLGFKLLAFIFYYHGISQGIIGSWFGKDKSTICRWLEDISLLAGIYLKNLMVDFSGKVAIDEKWIKIGDVWFYLFVAIDCVSGYPLLAKIYKSNSTNYCKLFLLELKIRGYIPKIIITDGWDSYIRAIKTVFPGAEHLLCRFHVIRSLFRRLRKAKIFNKEISKLIGNIFKTDYKKTVRRRISKIKDKLSPLVTVKRIMGGLDKKLPQVIKAVGNKNKPSTSNAAETF
ncbi:MAG: transposase, partial [Patescibacteria group bacterium]|nr:transposase [Patescibacteria group bacterium]